MSKRFKNRRKNAEKREKSAAIIDSFYGKVIAELERIKALGEDERRRLIEAANKGTP